ncbi:hypothetical protein PSHT_15683 [Puccinia striiformis]|uniref:Uncharacterized protein n=1 Tax=Puccinia striiformis TaxID=27350 RepID=A0A2S4UDP5_9BASI|nr:hypothetical protein PSHT_15683 [Puccinia striiformis]
MARGLDGGGLRKKKNKQVDNNSNRRSQLSFSKMVSLLAPSKKKKPSRERLGSPSMKSWADSSIGINGSRSAAVHIHFLKKKNKLFFSASIDQQHQQHQHQQQPVPSSPTKKIKLAHLPDFSTQMLLKPIENPPLKRKLKPKKQATTTRKKQNKPSSSSTTTTRSSSYFSFSFLVQVVICYLLLAYFYFCPKDPTSNQLVCSNLAELHWKLEPFLTPYTDQINTQIRQPLANRVDRKLRPIYQDYILPTWTHLHPQLVNLIDLSKRIIRQSGLIDQLFLLKSRYWSPIVDHVNQRYQEKLQPHILFTTSQTKQTYSIIKNSRIIKTTKFYFPYLQDFLIKNIVKPIHQTILPKIYDLFQQHIRPFINDLFTRVYGYLVTHDNPFKVNLKKIKSNYRLKLLRPVKILHQIYVKPQITKIVENGATRKETPIRDDDRISMKVDNQTEKKPSEIKEEASVNASSETEPILAESVDQSKTAEELDEPVDVMVDQPIDEHLDPMEEYDEGEEEDESSDHDPFLDLLGPEIDTEQSDATNDSVDLDNLTVDADDEIDSEIASEENNSSDSNQHQDPGQVSSEPERTERFTVEEVAAQRLELENLSKTSFIKLNQLKNTQLIEFLKKLTGKRSLKENLDRYNEFFKDDDRIQKLKNESEKLKLRINKYITRISESESLSSQEILKQIELIIEKSKKKFNDKLIRPNLNEIDKYGQIEYQNELEILQDSWKPISVFTSQVQNELGHVYNKFNSDTDRIKARMESILNGVISPLSQDEPNDDEQDDDDEKEEEEIKELIDHLPYPTFFIDIAHSKKLILDIHEQFEADLDAKLQTHSHPSKDHLSTVAWANLQHKI